MAQELSDWQRQLAAGIAEATSLDNTDRGPLTQPAELTEADWIAAADDDLVQGQGYLGELPR